VGKGESEGALSPAWAGRNQRKYMIPERTARIVRREKKAGGNARAEAVAVFLGKG